MNVALDGLDINGDWFLIVGGNGAAGVVTTFCVNLEMQNGTPPIITCIPDFVAFNDEGECGAVVNYTPATAVDGDTGLPLDVVLTAGGATGTSFPVGDNEVTFTATNEFGISSSCTFIISVEDNEAPMAVCGDFTVSLDDAGEGFLVASDLDGGSTDNCGVDSFAASQTTFGCSDVGDVTVVLEVYDVAGNMTSCEATVTVVDETAPVIECIGSQLSSVGGTSGAGEAISSTLPDVVSVLTVTEDQEILDLNLDFLPSSFSMSLQIVFCSNLNQLEASFFLISLSIIY